MASSRSSKKVTVIYDAPRSSSGSLSSRASSPRNYESRGISRTGSSSRSSLGGSYNTTEGSSRSSFGDSYSTSRSSSSGSSSSYSTAGTTRSSNLGSSYRIETLRVPDGERRYEYDSRDTVTSISRPSASVKRPAVVSVTNHNKTREDYDEPRSSDAKRSDYHKPSSFPKSSSSHRSSKK